MLYKNYENVSPKHSEIDQHMPKIEEYFQNLRKNIEEYIVQDVQLNFYKSYYENIYKVYNTLNTTGNDIIHKYKDITRNVDSFKSKLEDNKKEIFNYLKYIDSVYSNDGSVWDYIKILTDSRDKALLYFVNRYGLVDDLVVL